MGDAPQLSRSEVAGVRAPAATTRQYDEAKDDNDRCTGLARQAEITGRCGLFPHGERAS